MGVEVLPPDVNGSQYDFAVVDGKIHFGLNAVKNVGDSAARAIVHAREEGGEFTSLWDFTERVDPQVVNKRALESLVKCGALDSSGGTRRGMLEALENALSHGQRAQNDRLSGQSSLFGEAEAKPETTRRSARSSSRRTSFCARRRSRSASTSPSTRSRRSAPSCGARPTRRWPSSSAGGTARSSRSPASSARSGS